jgi:flavin reductase (DIM6/NTAB) family NADH-FMN oxidoreductase RutF
MREAPVNAPPDECATRAPAVRIGTQLIRSGALDHSMPTCQNDEFRSFMSCFPTGVAIVTSLDAHGRPHGMTCTSLTSVALSPPTLLVCLDHRSGTLRAVRESAAFAVNLLLEDAVAVARLFASATAERFARVAWHPSPLLGTPWLRDCTVAAVECRVVRRQAVADHDVVIAEVIAAAQRDDTPLVYGLRQFGGLRTVTPAEARLSERLA